MERIFQDSSPDLIFHAAAYKHVPLMEDNVCAAVQNNVLGLLTLLDLAIGAGCGSFILISSDKAVNPCSVMGATKRIGELIMAHRPTNGMRCLSVRFGNVLGSNGSVIPTLQQQLRNNEPLTVTHPEVKRFFMTIREAVSLVLQASVIGELHACATVLWEAESVELHAWLLRHELVGARTDRLLQVSFLTHCFVIFGRDYPARAADIPSAQQNREIEKRGVEVEANRRVVDDFHCLGILVQHFAPSTAVVLVAPFDVRRGDGRTVMKLDPAAQPKGGTFRVFGNIEPLCQRGMVVMIFTKVLDQRILQRHQEIVRARRTVMLLWVKPAGCDVGVPGEHDFAFRNDRRRRAKLFRGTSILKTDQMQLILFPARIL